MHFFRTRHIYYQLPALSRTQAVALNAVKHPVVQVQNCIIKQNRAKYGGGIYCSPTGDADISGCIIAQNTATETGGGVDVISTRGLVTITNCTITQNTAHDRGGGISTYIEFSQFTLTDSIVWDNHSYSKHHEVSPGGRRIIIKVE